MQTCKRPVQCGGSHPGNHSREWHGNVTQCDGDHASIEHDSSQRQYQHVGWQPKDGGTVEICSHWQDQYCLSNCGDNYKFKQRQRNTNCAREKESCRGSADEPCQSARNEPQVQSKLCESGFKRQIV